MKKTLLRKMQILIVSIMVILPALALSFALTTPAYAIDESALWGGKKDEIQTGMGDVGARDPREIAASVIKVLMGFLGIIAVVIILIGGFKWMTAGGNTEKTDEARKLITAGIIGLVIILAAFGIATFVINALLEATGT